VTDTRRLVFGDLCQIFGGFFIVAVSMVDPFVHDSIFSAQGGRDGMIDFSQVFLSKVESASPLLYPE
jgi:hypothetical protein